MRFRTAASSTMTLGGILKHMALVEDWWFSHHLLGREPAAVGRRGLGRRPRLGLDSAADDSPEELRSLWYDAVRPVAARRDDAALAGGLDGRAAGSAHGRRRAVACAGSSST